MRPFIPAFLAGCLIPSLAAAEPLTPLSFRAALETAKTYAADRTLVFYCLRHETEMVPFTYMIVHMETEDALAKLRANQLVDPRDYLLDRPLPEQEAAPPSKSAGHR